MCEHFFNSKTCSFGKCIDNICICSQGWNSIGDFVLVKGINCDINEDIIKYLSIASLALSILSIAIYIRYLYTRLSMKFEINSPKIVFPFCFLIHSVLDLVYVIAKIVNQNDFIVGKSIWLTLDFSACWFAAEIGMLFYLKLCINFLLGFKKMMSLDAQKRMTNTVDKIEFRLQYVFIISFLISFIPVLGFGAENSKYSIVGRIFWLCHALFFLSFLFMYTPLVNLVVQELNGSISQKSSINRQDNIIDDNRIRQVCRLLYYAKVGISIVLLTFFIFLSLIGSINFLLRKSVYIQVIITIAFHGVSLPMLATVSNFAIKSKVIPMNMLNEGTAAFNQNVKADAIQLDKNEDLIESM